MQLPEEFVNFRITEFPCLIDVYLHAIVILQGYLFLRIVFNAIVTHFIALKTLKSKKKIVFCLLKPNQGSFLDPPGFSIRVCSVGWWHSPRNSVEGRGLKVLELQILIKIRATGRTFS